MRDNHEGMIEFVDAFENDGHYFLVIRKEARTFQFGTSRDAYRILREALQRRPFDLMPGLRYRYFYVGSHRTAIGVENYSMDLRIELERDATKERIRIPKDLHANLLWFNILENIEDAVYLEIDKA